MKNTEHTENAIISRQCPLYCNLHPG